MKIPSMYSTVNALYSKRIQKNVIAPRSAAAKQGQRSNTAALTGNAKEDMRNIKQMLRNSEAANAQKNVQGQSMGSRIVDSMSNYRESLQVSRQKSKETSLNVKKVRYNFKGISSKLLRCKTSQSARQVASEAKREVMRLKRQKGNKEYDSEELEMAIDHAKAMERVAKKKARHLEEEEMAKASGGLCSGALEEEQDEKLQEQEAEEELSEEEYQKLCSENEEIEDRDFMDELEQVQIEQILASQSEADMNEWLSEMSDEMFEEMRQLMEDMGLDELMDNMGGGVERDMDPADLKMMKIKHRNRELKDIAEADGSYLKAVFEKLAKEKAGGGAIPGGSSASPGAVSSSPTMAIPGMAISAAPAMPAEAPSVSIDVSL